MEGYENIYRFKKTIETSELICAMLAHICALKDEIMDLRTELSQLSVETGRDPPYHVPDEDFPGDEGYLSHPLVYAMVEMNSI